MVALAQILNSRPIIYPGERRRPEQLQELLALTSRAVSLDPLDSRTHLCRSWSHAIAGSHDAALSHLELALDLNENDPWTIISAALGFAFAGEIERARDLIGQARAFGMRHSRAAQGYIATAAYLIGDYSVLAGGGGARGRRDHQPACLAGGEPGFGSAIRKAPDASMRQFFELARAAWVGAPRPSELEMIDWFMGCFPIRADETRADLRQDLLAALDEKRRLD